jgi:RHS repeat-associated protein
MGGLFGRCSVWAGFWPLYVAWCVHSWIFDRGRRVCSCGCLFAPRCCAFGDCFVVFCAVGGFGAGAGGGEPEWCGVAKVTETSVKGGVTSTRASTTTIDNAGRTTSFNVTSNIPGSVARPATEITYDSSTGLVTDTKATGSSTSVSRTYDGWGREKTYKNDQNEVTSTVYNTAGRVSSVTDPKGSTSYSYDGTDAKGKTEHRGLVTELKVSRGNGQGDLTYTGAYDPDGNLTKQGMPGQLATEYTYDPAGQLTDLTYTGQVTPVTEETDPDTGETTWTPGTPRADQPWLSWSRRYDVAGRVTAEWNGAGTAYEGIPGVTDPSDIEAPSVGQGLAADKRYLYDFAGRLTRVDDRTAADTGITLDPDTGGDPQAPCVRREYSFDKNGNRTKLKTSSSNGGDCFYATLDSEVDYAYDALDRPLKASDGTDYVYDSFGRQTLIPEADAPVNDAGDISVTYFDDDLAKTISQDGITTSFELDALARRTTSTITNNPTVVRHYGDDTDNPAWTTNSDGLVMRSAGSLDGLGAIIFGNGEAALTIGNPHGDNVTTVVLPVGHDEDTPAVSINGWADYDEYGVTKTGNHQGVTYGWLGKHERSASIESAGLTLMGVRLYNPIRGAFTSEDPIAGGNSTAYVYPQDPINDYDLSGESCKRCKLVSGIAFGLTIALQGLCFVAAAWALPLCRGGAAGVVASARYLTMELWAKKKKYNKSMGGKAAISGVNAFLAGAISPRIPKIKGEYLKYAVKNIRAFGKEAVAWLKQHRYESVATALLKVINMMVDNIMARAK